MDPLEEVYTHADVKPHRGLTREKIWDRGTVLEVTGEAIVFEVERHQSASGALYREGLAMSAFVTFWPRYRFDRSSHELTELEERRPREFDCDYDLLADEIIEYSLEFRVQKHKGEWVCKEQIGNREATVADEKDVQAFAERVVRDWSLETTAFELEDVLAEEELEAHLTRLNEALVAGARGQARRAWERRDENSW